MAEDPGHAVGFFIIDWNVAIFVKYLILVAVSFLFIMLVYELIVRRTGFMRFLFGMKVRGTIV